MELDLLKAQLFGLTPKRGEKHESDETKASVDRVAKLGPRSYPYRCKRLLLRSRRPPSHRDNRSSRRAHLEVAKKRPTAHPHAKSRLRDLLSDPNVRRNVRSSPLS